MKRRKFLKKASAGFSLLPFLSIQENLISSNPSSERGISTVQGRISKTKLGFCLTHEHLLVDFIGADQYNPNRWKREEVIKRVRPYLDEIKNLGCSSLMDCTPAFLGRDPQLLKELSELSGLQILTNTGYYGAGNNKFLPAHAFSENAEMLSRRWIREFKDGIGETHIRPGFMKIGVDNGPLSIIHKKLIQAAALAHQETGMVIASHTGGSIPAFEQLKVLEENSVSPDAFIWVHAQIETENNKRIEAARMGAWVSLDGLDETNITQYTGWLIKFRESGLLNRVLVSHDAGWYTPGEPDGGPFRGFTTVFNGLVPELKKSGFTEKDIEQVFVKNPAEAISLNIRMKK